MNDQPQMMNQSQMINQSQAMNQPQVMSQSQFLSQPQLMNQNSQMLNQPQLMNQNSQMLNQSQLMMNQSQSQGMSKPQMLNRRYGMWPPQTSMDPMKFPNPMKQGFVASKPPGRSNRKGKKGNDKWKDGKRKEMQVIAGGGSGPGVVSGGVGGGAGGGGYRPPTLNELQHQNRLKAKKFYPKKKFNNRFAPFAPRNTTSFIIRAKKSGGIASLVSPCPVTPAVLPTPIFSPSREVLGDMAKEEWGVDGYGSMNGLIRLRSPGNEADLHDDEDEEEGGSSESDVEEHVEVERRLDHDLSRFEMIYPNSGAGCVGYNNVLENRVDDQDTHIAQLEEENLILKERLFLMERELGDLRRRLLGLERRNQAVGEIHEEVVENVSENESEGRGDVPSTEENNEEVVEENNERGKDVESKEENNDEASETEGVADVCMVEFAHASDKRFAENQSKEEGAGDELSEKKSKEEGAGDEFSEKSKEEGAGDECSEKNIDDGDLSNCPALIGKVQALQLQNNTIGTE